MIISHLRSIETETIEFRSYAINEDNVGSFSSNQLLVRSLLVSTHASLFSIERSDFRRVRRRDVTHQLVALPFLAELVRIG